MPRGTSTEIYNRSLEQIKEFRKFYEHENNTLEFGRDILGYKDLYDPIHKPCIELINRHPLCLFLLPRGHLKSTAITITRTLQEVIRNPDIRIWIANATINVAENFLREIKGHIESNEMLKGLWPEIFFVKASKESPKWTETEIIVKRKKQMKEATITVGSVGKETTGMHYDLQVYDDIVNQDNVNTPDQIAKVQSWYRMTRSLLEPDGRRWVVGTRYDYSDLYGSLLETKIPRIVRKCIENDKVIFPLSSINESYWI